MGKWLGLGAFVAVAQVQPLVWDQRSYIKPLQAAAKKKKKSHFDMKDHGKFLYYFISRFHLQYLLNYFGISLTYALKLTYFLLRRPRDGGNPGG